MKEYNDINAMVDVYINSHKPTPNPIYQLNIVESNKTLESLDMVDFHAFIYNLHTGKFPSITFSNKSFLRYFMTSRTHNTPLDIANNLPYNREDFVKLLNQRRLK